MAWLPPNYKDAFFAELSADEKLRDRSFYHPALLGFHERRPPVDLLLAEWDRIGIIAAAPAPTDGKTVEDQVRDTFKEIIPSDARLVHEIKKLSAGSPHVHVRCGGCRLWAAPFEMLDVRSLPEVAERPILDKRNREYFHGPLVEVIDNELTQRDPITRAVAGDEATKQFRFTNSRPSVVEYEAPADLKNSAGFVCSGCWTRWIRLRLKIAGETYTKLRHIKLLGAPQDVIDQYSQRPGWTTPGMGAV